MPDWRHPGDGTWSAWSTAPAGLRDLVVAGRARPGPIATRHGGLQDAPGLDRRFDRRADRVVNAVLRRD